jgi:starch synthase
MPKIAKLLGFNKDKLKVLFVSAEEAPFAKAGGLGEVAFSLPRALNRLGHDARVMIPLYGSIDRERFKLVYVHKNLNVPSGSENGAKKIICNVRKYEPKKVGKDPVTTYFLENQEYYELRSNAYGYTDDRIRFALLSRGCLEFLSAWKGWIPDVIVCADWEIGYLPNLLKTEYKNNKTLANIATVFSIHNLAIQGTDKPQRFTPETARDDGHGPLPDFFDARMNEINPMRRGITNADVINTVSPTYAQEITSEEYGEGLEDLLREKRENLFGILNGIDYETNDPATDRSLASKFSSRNFDARKENKAALQKRLGLPQDKNVFVMGIVSRITRQKGFILLQPVIESFLRATGSQLVVVGTGETELMDFFLDLQKKLPEQVSAILQYDNDLPHLIYAGCDVLLIPSKYEPAGLTQMEAMRYGAVPVARRTGGLADTINDEHPGGSGTGFLFDNMDPLELLIAITRAYSGWRHRAEWKSLRKRVMEKDFSWERSAREYADLFKKAIAIHAENQKNVKNAKKGVQ